MAQEIAKQQGEDWIAHANVSAAATSAGFSGSDKPLKAVEKAILGKSSASGVVGELQRRMKEFAKRGMVRQHGADGR